MNRRSDDFAVLEMGLFGRMMSAHHNDKLLCNGKLGQALLVPQRLSVREDGDNARRSSSMFLLSDQQIMPIRLSDSFRTGHHTMGQQQEEGGLYERLGLGDSFNAGRNVERGEDERRPKRNSVSHENERPTKKLKVGQAAAEEEEEECPRTESLPPRLFATMGIQNTIPAFDPITRDGDELSDSERFQYLFDFLRTKSRP
jgi:hypothetical protein